MAGSWCRAPFDTPTHPPSTHLLHEYQMQLVRRSQNTFSAAAGAERASGYIYIPEWRAANAISCFVCIATIKLAPLGTAKFKTQLYSERLN